ncbi:cryptochrome/photolyase family protein [Oceanospirillum maris]|uniref:cryptochrome/photolyase family protein n=1 Tax=Oceanospirillum maris TaxID=64977 RepID=UPI000425138B|nr:FAD-binding domain-containing protein [Oceanospirillum maris]
MSHLVWFRADLRLHDNPALHTACQQAVIDGSGVVACFLRPQDQWENHHWGENRARFTERCLLDLGHELAQLNISLICWDVGDFNQQIPALLSLSQQLSCQHIWANEEPELNERLRDQALINQAQKTGIQCHFYNDQTLLPMGQILKKDGTPYRVYGAFRKQALKELERFPVQTLPIPQSMSCITEASQQDKITVLQADAGSLNVVGVSAFQPKAYLDDPIQQRWPATEAQAFRLLDSFCQERICQYDPQRDFPGNAEGTSLLSPLMATGKLSVKSCWLSAQQVQLSQPQGAQSAGRWLDELLWREFYRHLLVLYPELSCCQPFKPERAQIPWRNAPDDLAKWQQGTTGFPLVDAAMRQLKETGWMHNRLRMLTAVFLSKYLLIDWREGERWFMQHLVDGDLASNNGGWQWAASTGTDSVPYFRLLSPYRQAERFDAQGAFIARFVPELASLPAKQRIQPKGYVKGYPVPMLDLREGKDRMMAAFKSASFSQT